MVQNFGMFFLFKFSPCILKLWFKSFAKFLPFSHHFFKNSFQSHFLSPFLLGLYSNATDVQSLLTPHIPEVLFSWAVSAFSHSSWDFLVLGMMSNFPLYSGCLGHQSMTTWVIGKSPILAGRLWHYPGGGNVVITSFLPDGSVSPLGLHWYPKEERCSVTAPHLVVSTDTGMARQSLLLGSHASPWFLFIPFWQWSSKERIGHLITPMSECKSCLHWRHRRVGCYFGVAVTPSAPCYSSF